MSKKYFAGTSKLVLFILKRDRIRLLAWVLSLLVVTVGMVPMFGDMFTSEAELNVMAETMLNPAMIALVGPVYGINNYHVAAMYSNTMLLFICIIVAVMNIFLVTRHTRSDEEQGRLEVVRSLPVGRLTTLAATLLTALSVNVVIALLTGLGISLCDYGGITLAGAMLFGVAMGVIGMLFAAITAFICQLTANTRSATGLSLMLLMLLYLMRAAGDLNVEALALASPLGLVLRSKVFVENIWWPILLILATIALTTALAFVLAGMRDLGQGLLPQRPGRRHGSIFLCSPMGLAWRLTKTTTIVWAVIIFTFSATFASVFGDMEGFLANNATLSAIFTDDSTFSDQYIALIFIMMSLLSTVPILSIILRINGEEKQGFSENLFGKSVSRLNQYACYLSIALVTSVLLQILTALGFWSVASVVTDSQLELGLFIQAGMAYLPAMWVVLGLTAFLIGWLPRLVGFVYGYLGIGFFVIYVGAMVQIPEWANKLVTYSLVPRIPVEELEALPLMVMMGIAVVLGLAGCIGYRKRDMTTG